MIEVPAKWNPVRSFALNSGKCTIRGLGPRCIAVSARSHTDMTPAHQAAQPTVAMMLAQETTYDVPQRHGEGPLRGTSHTIACATSRPVTRPQTMQPPRKVPSSVR